MRLLAACAAADFFRSETARPMPSASCLRILKRCRRRPPAFPHGNGPHHREIDRLRQQRPGDRIAAGMSGLNVGAHSKGQERNQQAPGQYAAGEIQSGKTRSNDVAHTKVSGLTSGAVKMVAPPVMVVATLGLVLVRSNNFLPRALM